MPEISQVSAVEIAAAPARPAPARAPSAARPSYPGLIAALARNASVRARQRLADALFETAPYRLTLRGPLTDRLAVVPDMLVPATLEQAQDILRGRFSLPSGVIDVRDASPFDMEVAPRLQAELHRFEWLAHLEKAGGKTAAFVARALTEDWLDRFRHYKPLPWRPDILGPRVVAWAAHFRFLTSSNDLVFRSRLLRAMSEQTRHLQRALPLTDEEGLARIEAAASLLTMAAVLPDTERRRDKAIEGLRLAVEAGVLPDGGLVTRCLRDQGRAVALLTTASRALADAHLPEPPFLASRLAAMRNALSMMRHGDGRLACFNGTAEDHASWLDDVLDGQPPPEGPRFAPSWGYARLVGDTTTVLFDCGGPPPGSHAVGAHRAPLSFEFSRGETRIVVNGGVAWRRGGDWPDAARHTAAHATLQIGDVDAGTLLEGFAARELGPRLYGGRVGGSLEAADEGLRAEGVHDLYLPRFGVTHRRRLFLDTTGEDLRGEDRLVRSVNRGRLDVALRFPLHPDCKAAIAQGGDSVLITPPASEAWRFRVDLTSADQTLALEPAIYMGGEVVRHTQAIVLYATPIGNDWTARWAIKLENPYRRSRRRLV